MDFYLFSLCLFSSCGYHAEFFFQKQLPLKIFSSVGNFLKSFRLLPFDFFCSRLFPSVIIRFSFPVSSLLLFTSFPAASTLPILVELFSLTFFLLYFFDWDVRYIRLLFYSRRSNLTVLWSVPPFLKLWGNSLSFCWSVPLFLNFSPHIYMKYIFIYRLDYVVFCISYVEIIITRQFPFVNTFFKKILNFFYFFRY